MAKGKRSSETETAAPDPIKRLADLVALLLVKGEKQPEKIRSLAAVGYSAAEIANLLGTTANTVSVTLYQLRKK